MAWYKSFKGKNGEINTFDWSLQDSVNFEFTVLIFKMGLLMLCSSIASAYCLLMYSPSIRKHRVQQLIAAILASTFWILDFQFGIFSWFVLHDFMETYILITNINWILLIISVVLLFIDESFYNFIHSTGEGWFVSLGIFIGVTYLTYPMLSDLFSAIFTVAEVSIWK